MANVCYPQGVAHLIGKATKLDLIADNIIAIFYSGSYSSAHEFISDLTGASIIARSGNLAGKTSTNGVFDANDTTLTAVTGASFTHIILAKNSGADATSPLYAFMDVASFAPSGRDVTIVWNASGISSHA